MTTTPRALVLAALAATVQAALLSGGGRPSRGSASLGEDSAVGLRFHPERLDFLAERPSPLSAVDVNKGSEDAWASASGAGETSLMISADLSTGGLFLQPMKGQDAELPHGRMPIAWAQYNNTVRKNGWSYLWVKASPTKKVSPELKVYAAGYLEGFVTARQIRDFQHNAGILLQDQEDQHHALNNINSMFDKELHNICNESHIIANSTLSGNNAPSDPWWRQARYALLQSWGVLDAYNRQVDLVFGKPMSLVDLMVLSGDGETPELEMAYDMEEFMIRQSNRWPDSGESDDSIVAEAAKDDDDANATAPAAPAAKVAPASATALATKAVHMAKASTSAKAARGAKAMASGSFLQKGRMSRHLRPRTLLERRQAERAEKMRTLDDKAWRRIKDETGRCSALVRLADANKDIMVGHTTFSDYSEMTRVFKYYDLPIEAASQRMAFSSYPGIVGSTDDYYVMDSGLVVTETTLSMLTDEPYDKLDDNGTFVPDFMRIMMASRMARDGHEWTRLMSRSASGTYSSQWMVVDYNRFEPGKPLKNGTLFVLEQVPGLSHVEDATETLQRQGFWASENRAWFKDVRDDMGATEAESDHGRLFSRDKNPRAHTFAATAPKVATITDMRGEMQRNKWPHDIDGGDDNTPDHAIAARGDLGGGNNPNGGVDSKVTNACMAKKLQVDAISGPSHADQTPFRWKDGKGKDLFPGVPHDGLPDVWNFDWVRMTPDGEKATHFGEC